MSIQHLFTLFTRTFWTNLDFNVDAKRTHIYTHMHFNVLYNKLIILCVQDKGEKDEEISLSLDFIVCLTDWLIGVHQLLKTVKINCKKPIKMRRLTRIRIEQTVKWLWRLRNCVQQNQSLWESVVLPILLRTAQWGRQYLLINVQIIFHSSKLWMCRNIYIWNDCTNQDELMPQRSTNFWRVHFVCSVDSVALVVCCVTSRESLLSIN